MSNRNKSLKKFMSIFMAAIMIAAMSVSTMAADTGGATINNTATIVSENGKSESITSNTVSSKVTKPILKVKKTTDATDIRPGDQITYKYVVTNSGDAVAQKVKINDTIDTSFYTFVSATNSGGITYNLVGVNITWTINEIQPDSSAEFELVLKVKDDVSPGTGKEPTTPSGGEESGGEQGKVEPDPEQPPTPPVTVVSPKIEISKTVDKETARSGEVLTYTITVSNKGDGSGRNIKVRDIVDTNHVTINPSSLKSTENVKVVNSDGTIDWTITSLAPSANEELTFTVTVK